MATEPSYNAAFFSSLLGISERHVARLARSGVIPKVGRGQYPLHGVVQGYVDELRRQAEGSRELNDYRAHRARRERAAADRLEFDLARQRRSYIRSSALDGLMLRFADQATVIFRAGLSRLKNRLPHLTVREFTFIEKELAGVLTAIEEVRPSRSRRKKSRG